MENRFSFQFQKAMSFTLKMKSVEFWNILRYDTYIPDPNCTYLNCNEPNEKEFFEKIDKRGKLKVNFLFLENIK